MCVCVRVCIKVRMSGGRDVARRRGAVVLLVAVLCVLVFGLCVVLVCPRNFFRFPCFDLKK